MRDRFVDLPAHQRRRRRMVRDQLGDCTDRAVVAAMESIPRHACVVAEATADAYGDFPWPLAVAKPLVSRAL